MSVAESLSLKELQGQLDAVLRGLELQEVRRVGNEVLVQDGESAEVDAGQERERHGRVRADDLHGDVDAVQDLAGFPLLTKDDFRRNYPRPEQLISSHFYNL